MKYLILLIALFTSLNLRSQVKADGYISAMPTWYRMENLNQKFWENNIHNRINLSYDFSSSVIGVVQFRNRLIHGKTVRDIPGYAAVIDTDQGFLDMSYNLASGTSAILNMTIDRLWMDFYLGKVQIRAGRQRINWGQAMVWNPNDIFNAYSFFDLDYPERPGIDGVRIQWFTGMTSQMEGVFKIDRNPTSTIALRYRFNALRYDWQLLGGKLNTEEWAAGLGWSGQIGDAGFYGEGTYIIPDNEQEVVIASTGIDYTFKNSLLWRSEFLFSSNLSSDQIDFTNFISGQASIKNLSVAKYSIFTSFQYPVTPLFNATLNGMLFPGVEGWHAGTTLEYSVSTNLFFTTFFNLFVSKSTTNTKNKDYLGALRIKWFF